MENRREDQASLQKALDIQRSSRYSLIMDKAVFVFGEQHGKNPETLSYVRTSMRLLAARGVKNIAFELPEDRQADFLAAAKSGAKEGFYEMPRQKDPIARRLAGDDRRARFLPQHLELAREAMKIGLSIHCVDLPARELVRDVDKTFRAGRRAGRDELIRQGGGEQTKAGKLNLGVATLNGMIPTLEKRNSHMAEGVSRLSGGTILLVGMSHTGGHGGVESHLRKRGMRAVATDIYPVRKGANNEEHRLTENPAVEFRVAGQAEPTRESIAAKISRLASLDDKKMRGLEQRPLPRTTRVGERPRRNGDREVRCRVGGRRGGRS